MGSPEIKIRRARQGDIGSLITLLSALFAIEQDFVFNEKKQHKGLNLLLECKTGTVLVAEINGGVVGMCTGQLVISTAEGGCSLLVEDVVVAGDWRGRGIGSTLLDRLSLWGAEQGACRMQLLADRTNKNALDFYDKLGWQQTQLICLRKRDKG